jgi:DNA gyrase subunit A
MGRNTQGVRLINLTKGEKLTGMERIAEADEDEVVEGEGEGDSGDEAE